MSVWPYSTQRWQRLRLHKLRQQPLCEACLQVGEIVPATVVDHRAPITKSGREERLASEAFPSLDRLASLCERHHNEKTNAEQRGEDCLRKGCDIFGRPNDPDHPWHNQLRVVMTAAGALSPALRSRFLELVVVHLRYPRDSELDNAMRLALKAIERRIGDAA